MRQHLRMCHPERKAQVQADLSLVREITVKDTPSHVISDTALDTPPAVAVRSVVHIAGQNKKVETPLSLCSPGFQLPVELQNLLDNNCQDVLQTAAAAASISSEVVPEQPSIVKLVAVPINVQSARVHQEASEKNDLPATVTDQRLVLPTDIDPNIPYIPERCRALCHHHSDWSQLCGGCTKVPKVSGTYQNFTEKHQLQWEIQELWYQYGGVRTTSKDEIGHCGREIAIDERGDLPTWSEVTSI